jgi:hypothetical protein
MTDTGDALRDTSDALLRDLDALATMEGEKRVLEPGDPKILELATRIEEIAARVLAGTTYQRRLSELGETQVVRGSPGAPTEPIEATERPMELILAEWREAERRLASASPDSVEESEARVRVKRLRDEYRRAHEAIRDR